MQSSLNRLVISFFILMFSLGAAAQTDKGDMELIRRSVEEHDHSLHSHNPSFLLKDHTSAFVRYNPVTLAFGSMMWLYQKVVSPQFSSTCLYHPSCSAYSMNLISTYGLVPGIIYTTDRLMRCNKLSLIDFNSWEADEKTGKIPESILFYKLNE